MMMIQGFVQDWRPIGAVAAVSILVSGAVQAEPYTLFSPAAAPNPMWSINEGVAAKLDACGVGEPVKAEAEPLPQSVNRIGAEDGRASNLPIVTTVDFDRARIGGGPEWHTYGAGHDDLKFVAGLYDVGIGMMALDPAIQDPADLEGRTIAVPMRPSSLRVMAETILRDGYGLALEHVTLVDLPPNKVAEAAARGEIDATTWNMVIEIDGAMRPMMPDLEGHWMPIDESQIARMNAHGDVTTAALAVAGTDAKVLSFRQALTAWDSTPDEVVLAMLECLEKGSSREEMRRWPGLTSDAMHAGARQFYGAN